MGQVRSLGRDWSEDSKFRTAARPSPYLSTRTQVCVFPNIGEPM